AQAYMRGEAASPVFDPSGRLWLAYLTLKQPNEGWQVWFTGFHGAGCTPAKAIAAVKGFDRRPVLVIAGDTALAAVQFDNIVRRPSSRAEAIATNYSKIMLAAIDLRQSPAWVPSTLAPLIEPKDRFEAGEMRV